MAKSNSEGTTARLTSRRRFMPAWFLMLSVLTLLAGYFYYWYQQKQEPYNNYYFRTLNEVSAELNTKLSQLKSVHKFAESQATKKALFPSYREGVVEDNRCNNQDKDCVKLIYKGDQVEVHWTAVYQKAVPITDDTSDQDLESAGISDDTLEQYSQTKAAAVDIADILPMPENGFNLYLLVDGNNKVLGHTSAQNTLSIVDTTDISLLVRKKRNQSWLKLSPDDESKGHKGQNSGQLPGYSSYIDMDLPSGSSRVFLYPFNLNAYNKWENGGDASCAGHITLYLVGVLPDNALGLKNDRRWNLTVLIFILGALGFIWVMLRLSLLSPNTALGNSFYISTHLASYSLFLLLVSGLIAFGEWHVEKNHKSILAKNLTAQIRTDTEHELYQIFTQMESYRNYYKILLSRLHEIDIPAHGELRVARIQNKQIETPQDQLYDCTQLIAFPGTGDSGATPVSQIRGVRLSNGRWYRLGNTDYHSYCYFRRNSSSTDVNSEPSMPGKVDSGGAENALAPINFYGAGADTIQSVRYGEWFDPSDTEFQRNPRSILNVFLMNEQGMQILPRFYYKEDNKAPQHINLAHRDYFRKVRDQEGWSGTFTPEIDDRADGNTETGKDTCSHTYPEKDEMKRCIKPTNFFIQRLFNIGSGTRGTTLGMPLVDGQEMRGAQNPYLRGKIIGSDITLASLTHIELPVSEELQDLTAMVVDRKTGEVLFHIDNDRSMIENLYHAGRGSAPLKQALRTDRVARRDVDVKGNYHGDPGTFWAGSLPIKQWAVVVFIPDNNIDSYISNLFLANAASMGAILIVIAVVLFLLHLAVRTNRIKTVFGIPLVLDQRRIMAMFSLYTASIYLGYWLGSALDRAGYSLDSYGINSTLILPIVAMLVCLIPGKWLYDKMYGAPGESQGKPTVPTIGALILGGVFLLVGGVITSYLHHVGIKPVSAPYWHYDSLYCARINKDQQELREVVLSRYPNSITRYQVDPLSLMPEVSNRFTGEKNSDRYCKEHQKSWAMPEDIGHFSQLTHSTGISFWVRLYLLGERPNQPADDASGTQSASDDPENSLASQNDASGKKSARDYPRRELAWRYVPVMVLLFLVLSTLWIVFNRHVLGTRLSASPGFLRHLNQIAIRKHPGYQYAPGENRIIDLTKLPDEGQNLGLLLHRLKLQKDRGTSHDDSNTQKTGQDNSDNELDDLYSLCPLLEQAAACDNPFPCIKIKYSKNNRSVKLWDIEYCLSHSRQRDLLLRLIDQLKSLQTSDSIDRITLYMDFHALERLLLKADTLDALDTDHPQMGSGEYTAWAETLMDFDVRLPEEITAHIDKQFIQNECEEKSFLEKLSKELHTEGNISLEPSPATARWIDLPDRKKTQREWASINYILMKAGALFRFKWESCSPAEKLALYHLARHKRVSPANTQMLEQLALEGLIRVRDGRIRILNNSFAYFVRHAEDADTLKAMVQLGNSGNWQNYGLFVTLSVLLIIVVIAIYSGSSLYTIVAGLVGFMGMIGTLTTSTRIIRENATK